MTKSKRPVRIMILTSVRDVGACDLNGSMVSTKEGPKYMMGIVEHMTHECRTGGALNGLCTLSGIITDDTEKDLARSAYPQVPVADRQWIHPLNLEYQRGKRVTDITVHVPSSFRSLPRDDIKGRHGAKRAFEAGVYELMKLVDADVLLLDHYMARIEHLINGQYGLYGKVINIHPAVTVPGHPHCFRGPTPTADAIAHAKCNGGAKTGATLHVVNEKFDDGPVIHWDAPTPVYADDSAPELRLRNYRMAKLPVFVWGMQKYLREVFTHA